MSTPACILVYGSDVLLLRTRVMILEKAGFCVFSAEQAEDAHSIVESQDLDLAVLCHSLSLEACESFLTYASSRKPDMRTLTLTAGVSACAEITPGAVVSAFDGPRKLVETVQQLLEGELAPS